MHLLHFLLYYLLHVNTDTQNTLVQRRRVMKTAASFMSVKRSEGAGGKHATDADAGRSTRLLACLHTPTGVFTPTDVDHMLRGRRRLLDYSL